MSLLYSYPDSIDKSIVKVVTKINHIGGVVVNVLVLVSSLISTQH